jgi:hypothetical protein
MHYKLHNQAVERTDVDPTRTYMNDAMKLKDVRAAATNRRHLKRYEQKHRNAVALLRAMLYRLSAADHSREHILTEKIFKEVRRAHKRRCDAHACADFATYGAAL